KTGIALFRTLSTTTGPPGEAMTSTLWTRTITASDETAGASSATANAAASANVNPAHRATTSDLPILFIASSIQRTPTLILQSILVDRPVGAHSRDNGQFVLAP